MGNSLLLTMFRKSPHADSQVELFDSDGGFLLYGFPAIGDPTLDEYDTPIRTLAFTFLIQGTNKNQQDMIDKADRVQGMLMRTARYIDKKKGNLPVPTDGTWHEGRAASAIFWPMGAATPVYYDVMGGSIALKENFTDVKWGQAALACVITLTIRSDATKDQRTLDNLVRCGDIEAPFNLYDLAFQAGWTFPNANNWCTTTEQRYWGSRSLKGLGSSSDYFTTNASAAIIPGDVLVPTLMLKYTGTAPSSANMSFDLQTSPDGSTWASPSGILIPDAIPLQADTWTPVSLPAYTVPASGVSFVRLAFNIAGMTAATSLYFDGLAIWRNPLNGQKPDEYVTGGYSLGMPHLNVYGVKGDTDAPALLSVFPVSNAYLGDVTYIGCRSIDMQADLPLNVLDFGVAAPMLRETFNTTTFTGVTESGHVLTPVQGTFANLGGSLFATSDANGDALYATVGLQRYTSSIYVAGTLNSASNYRVPQIVIGIPGSTHAHQRVYLQNGNVKIDTYNDDGTQAGTTSAATTTADGTGYLLSVHRSYSSGVYKLTVSVNGTALISNYNFAPSSGVIDGTRTGLRLAKGGSPATSASWDVWTVVMEAGLSNGPTEIPQIFSTTFMWGEYAVQNVSSITSASATFALNGGAALARMVDREDRTYRALAVFQSSATSSAVGSVASGSLTINSETRTYTNFANSVTYPAATNAGGFTIIDMGDFEFGRPGNMWPDLVEALDTARASLTLTNTGLNTTGYGMFVSGVLLLAAEQFGEVKSPAKTYGFLINTDGDQARAGNYDINNFYLTGVRPENVVPHDNMVASGCEFTLPPAIGQRTFVTQFQILPLYVAPDNTYYNNAATQYHVSVRYQPHFRLGVG